MTIKHIAILITTSALFALLGCTDADPKESKVIEQAAAQTPVLTSTKAPSALAAEKAPSIEAELDELEKKPEPMETPVTKVESETPSLEPTLEAVDGLKIQRFVITSKIEEREPTAQASTFGTDHERIYAFVEVSNESESEKSLMVHFIGPGGKVSGGIELEIPASVPRWRTWAYTRHAKTPGSWRVEIRDVDGTLIGALPFEVEPAI